MSNTTKKRAQPTAPARVEYLRVENYRALRNVELKDLTPLTALLGPNGSGESTIFDVFDFLSACCQYGLRHAEQHAEHLEHIFQVLRRRVPRLESVLGEPMPDGRLLLQIKDAPFDRPVMSRYASDGTLKLLAYLTVLHDPEPPQLVSIEEPENFLHPRLLPELAEECRAATERSQLFVTTRSPFFIDTLKPEEVRALYRDDQGYTQAVRVSDIQGVPEFVQAGASLGHLRLEGHLGVGDPLVNAGAPQLKGRRK